MELSTAHTFRVTRDSEFEIDDEVDDLLRAIEDSVRQRKRGHEPTHQLGEQEQGLRRAKHRS